LEDAYKVATYDRKLGANQRKVQAEKEVKVQQKVAANMETSTIPASSGLPQPKKMSVREFVEKQLQGEQAKL